LADKDETMPVSSDQNTNPKMSLATNNTERRYTGDSIHESSGHNITAKYIPKTEPKSGEKEEKK